MSTHPAPPGRPAATPALKRKPSTLAARLAEAEETLRAIRQGEVDAVIVKGEAGPLVYTLLNADRPYRNIVERMQEGALTLTPDGTILYANQRLAAFLGLALPEIAGQKLGKFIAAKDQHAFAQLLAAAPQGGGRGDMLLRPAAGEPVPVYLSVADLKDEEQQILSCIVTDLRGQKHRMQEMAKANALLIDAMAQKERAEVMLRHAQKMEAVGQLTAGIAHDFNNLLMVIGGNLELFEKRVTDDWLKRRVDASLHAVERGARLTQQLLAFARAQNLQPQIISVHALLLDIEPLLRSAMGGAIRLTLALGTDLPQCLVDAGELQAALLNLITNAREAMPDGGSINISTEPAELAAEPDDGTDGIQAGRYLAITVTDTGHGMAPDTRERAFDPFFTTKGVGQGTGLGLSRVYGFMRQSGGHVAIESAVGAGTTVQLYLPWTGTAAATAAPATPAPPALRAPESCRVLVVEDDHNLRVIVVEVLNTLGYATIAAESGPAALRLLAKGMAVDLLFSDVLMPDGMTGFQLAEEAQRRLPHIAIVLTSGMTGMPHHADRAAQSWQILRKPYKFAALATAIEAALGAVCGGGEAA